jgi:hypothetical protein
MSFIKGLILGFGTVTVVIFLRNFLWPWLYNEYFLWRNARILRRLVKMVKKHKKDELTDLARMLEELASVYDQRRANNKF